jgi:hypothetical protein
VKEMNITNFFIVNQFVRFVSFVFTPNLVYHHLVRLAVVNKFDNGLFGV